MQTNILLVYVTDLSHIFIQQLFDTNIFKMNPKGMATFKKVNIKRSEKHSNSNVASLKQSLSENSTTSMSFFEQFQSDISLKELFG